MEKEGRKEGCGFLGVGVGGSEEHRNYQIVNSRVLFIQNLAAASGQHQVLQRKVQVLGQAAPKESCI